MIQVKNPTYNLQFGGGNDDQNPGVLDSKNPARRTENARALVLECTLDESAVPTMGLRPPRGFCERPRSSSLRSIFRNPRFRSTIITSDKVQIPAAEIG